jgi:CubicO group peptidase (beta-lactamase class C family)
MDRKKLELAIAYGRERGGSGLVIRGGRVIGQWGNQATKYALKSTTKSFGSVLLGVALRDQRLTLDTPIASRLAAELATQEPLAEASVWVPQLKVRHLATHTGGFAKVGGIEPMLFAPGTGWFYSDSGPNWLADFLTVTYMKDLAKVLNNRVLRPMGLAADRVVWRENQYRAKTLRGIVRREFGSGISTDVDVMARLGLMLLRDGRWGATRILPPTYADLAGAQAQGIAELPWLELNPDNCSPPNTHYGLLFWNNAAGYRTSVPRDAYWAAGLGTSFIFVIPSLDIVVSRAGPKWPEPENPCGSASAPFTSLLADAVLPVGGGTP